MATRNMPATTKAQYKSFLNNVELHAIGLDSITAELDRQLYADVFSSAKPEIVQRISTRFSVSDFDGDHFDITGRFDFSMVAEDFTKPLLEVSASFSAHFHPKDGSFAEKDAEKFAGSEGRLLFWPYFRQALADTTARMYIRPITIPFAFNP